MIYEHEIPEGSRLYFSKSAKLKREIEAVASEILYDEGFEEIVTPYFSYHQILDEKNLIRFSDKKNNILSLRTDSTLDVVRIISRRLGRATEQKRWFYIQPVFRYPSEEIYQIGGEFIGDSNLKLCMEFMIRVFENFKLEPLLYISNVKIPTIISKMFNVSIDIFKNGQIEDILNINEKWLIDLVNLQDLKDIDNVIEISPKQIQKELLKIKTLAQKIKYKNVVLAPLFYSKMRYYDALFFSFIDKNETLGNGGSYHFEEQESAGFGLYTDSLIETIMKKD